MISYQLISIFLLYMVDFSQYVPGNHLPEQATFGLASMLGLIGLIAARVFQNLGLASVNLESVKNEANNALDSYMADNVIDENEIEKFFTEAKAIEGLKKEGSEISFTVNDGKLLISMKAPAGILDNLQGEDKEFNEITLKEVPISEDGVAKLEEMIKSTQHPNIVGSIDGVEIKKELIADNSMDDPNKENDPIGKKPTPTPGANTTRTRAFDAP